MRKIETSLYESTVSAAMGVVADFEGWANWLTTAVQTGASPAEIIRENRVRATVALLNAREFAKKAGIIHEQITAYIDERSERWWDTSEYVADYEAWQEAWEEHTQQGAFLVEVLEDVERSHTTPWSQHVLRLLQGRSAGADSVNATDLYLFSSSSNALRSWRFENVDDDGADESDETSQAAENPDVPVAPSPGAARSVDGTVQPECPALDANHWSLDDLKGLLQNWFLKSWDPDSVDPLPFPQTFAEA